MGRDLSVALVTVTEVVVCCEEDALKNRVFGNLPNVTNEWLKCDGVAEDMFGQAVLNLE